MSERRRPTLAALARLAASWWRRDRIRVSPREGRLLRLAPPAIVVIAARPAEVIARITGQSAAGPYVRYVCRTAHGRAELSVTPVADAHAPTVRWSEDGVERAIDADDVEVYAPRRSADLEVSGPPQR